MARLPRSHPGIPAELDRYLTPSEKIVFRTRLHWVKIVRPWTLVVLTMLLIVIIDSNTTSGSTRVVGNVEAVVLILVVARALFHTFQWYREWFVGTDRRLMLTMGIVTRRVAMIPLGKVTDMSYVRHPMGQLLGYGSFVLESAGQDQAFREVEYVPNPGVYYRRISEELFTPGGRRSSDRPTPVAKALPVQEPSDPWWKRS
ncbi:MAG TPA: PH domain-containing protein [Kineosporiaceae bacterium]|nr:PH domain-containing protein [Kineosporiaceae bacterium]